MKHIYFESFVKIIYRIIIWSLPLNAKNILSNFLSYFKLNQIISNYLLFTINSIKNLQAFHKCLSA